MQIKSKSGGRERKLNIAIIDLIVLGLVLIVSMLISALAGIYYFDKQTVNYYVGSVQSLISSIFNDELQNETYLATSNELDTLVLNIPFDSYQNILQKRNQAVQTGILLSSDEDYLNAEANLNQENPIRIQLRLKGDWTDHLETSKWSYRIHTKGDGQILGMTKFSIQSPETRNYLFEWGFHQHLLMEDVLTTSYEFVNVVENGQNKGIYTIEESFNVELLESQGERQGIILRFDEDALWMNRANFTEESFAVLEGAQQDGLFMVTNNEQAEIKVFQSTSISASPVLNAEAQTAIAALQGFIDGKLSAEEVFDVQKFGLFLAIADLWGANHATYWHNLRYYYNPITSLLEPIGYDGDASGYSYSELAIIFSEQTFFDHPAIRRAYAIELERITQPGYLNSVKQNLAPGITTYLPALRAEFGDETIHEPWAFLELRTTVLHNQLHPPFPVLGRYTITKDNSGDNQLSVKLKNLMILPVSILSVEIQQGENVYSLDTRSMENSGDLLIDQVYPEVTYVNEIMGVFHPMIELRSPLSTDQIFALTQTEELTVHAIVKISGLAQIYRIPIFMGEDSENIGERPIDLFSQAYTDISRHPFLKEQGAHTLVIEAGDWTVAGDLIIPEEYDLVIMPGTTLRFQEEAILLSSGRILAKGTEEKPIHLTSSTDHWAGIVILSAEQKSVLEYTIIENTASINRAGWILTGGVTFYESPVYLFHTRFVNHVGEDALNLVHSDYEMQYVEISNSASDALDTDFSDGLIANCSFNKIGGDAIDVSGSHTTIEDSFMVLIADKAVSAGEKSFVNISNIKVDSANIGIASKDLSEVTIDGINLHAIQYAGFVAYIKKPVYGPASIDAKNIVYTDVKDLAIVQYDSRILLDGVEMPTRDLAVETLYELGILGN